MADGATAADAAEARDSVGWFSGRSLQNLVDCLHALIHSCLVK
jgi:hypothetical protein